MSTPTPGRSDDVTDKIVAALDRIARGVRTHRQSVATGVGLTPLQLELLRTIASGPPPRPTPGALATELGVSQPTVTDSIAALERKGHVVRRPDPADRRRSHVVVTRSGAQLVERAERADVVLREMFAELDDADRERLLGVLLDSITALLDADVITVARTCPTCRFFEPGPVEGARCNLLDTTLAPAALRVNCAEHLPTLSATSR